MFIIEAFTWVWGNRENGIYFWGTGEQMPPFEGTKGTIGEQGT